MILIAIACVMVLLLSPQCAVGVNTVEVFCLCTTVLLKYMYGTHLKK